MEKGRGLLGRSSSGFGEGRKGWKSIGPAALVDIEGGDTGGEDGDLSGEWMGEEEDSGAGLSVTLISGEPGGVSLSVVEPGGLAGSTTSTGRLSRLIMMSYDELIHWYLFLVNGAVRAGAPVNSSSVQRLKTLS